MTDIKSRLEHLAELTKGPELIWPDVSDVAKVALARIKDLEAETERLAAMVRFHVRRYLKEKDIPTTATKAALKALKVKEDKRKTNGETAVDRTARYFKSGMDCDAIALRMDLNVSTVYGYLSKARHRGLIEQNTRVPMGKKKK